MKDLNKEKSVEYFAEKIEKEGIETVTFGMVDLYGRLMGKKIDSDYFKDKVLKGNVFACDYLLSSDIQAVPLANAKLASFEKGYGDFMLTPRVSTGREVRYVNDKHELLFFGDVCSQEGERLRHSPSQILQETLEAVEKAGLEATVQVDIEGTLVSKNYRKLHGTSLKEASLGTKGLSTHSAFYSNTMDEYFEDLSKQFKLAEIPVSSFEIREGEGQIGIKLLPQTALSASEDIVLLKLVFC